MDNIDSTFAGILISITITFWLFFYVRARLKKQWFQREGMPQELQDSQLVASEKEIWGVKPVPLFGTLDQLFLMVGRRLVLVETKNHNTGLVYESDRIQISVYASIIRNSWWRKWHFYKMESYGYVRIVSKGKVKYVRVDYLSDEEVSEMYYRYREMRAGEIIPRHTRIRALCNTCAYHQKCDGHANGIMKKVV